MLSTWVMIGVIGIGFGFGLLIKGQQEQQGRRERAR